MSLIKTKKSKQLEPTNGHAKPETEENFEIRIPKKSLKEMDAYLEGVPHGIARQIIAFFQQFPHHSIPAEKVKANQIDVP